MTRFLRLFDTYFERLLRKQSNILLDQEIYPIFLKISASSSIPAIIYRQKEKYYQIFLFRGISHQIYQNSIFPATNQNIPIFPHFMPIYTSNYAEISHFRAFSRQIRANIGKYGIFHRFLDLHHFHRFQAYKPHFSTFQRILALIKEKGRFLFFQQICTISASSASNTSILAASMLDISGK